MATKTQASLWEGWSLFWLVTFALGAMAVAMLVSQGFGTDGFRLVIRATARTSIIFFLAAFTASAAARLWPSDFTRWLRRNRRQLGLIFAMSHFIHAFAIIALWQTDPGTFWTLSNKGSIIAGGTAYIFIAALAATSFNAMVRALGPKTWGRLHWAGVWFIAISFILTNGKRIPVSTFYAFPVALVVLAMALRIIASRKQRAVAIA